VSSYPTINLRRPRGQYGPSNPKVKYDWYVNGNLEQSGNGRSLNGGFLTLAEARAAAGAGASIWVEYIYDGSPYREEWDFSGLTGIKAYSSLTLFPTYTYIDGIFLSGWYICGMNIVTPGAQIDCRDIIENDTFTKTAGQTNVYEKEVTFESGVTDPHVKMWEDSVVFELVADVGTCDSTPGSYYIADHSTSPQTIYVHASDSSDVTTNGKQYEYNPRANAVILDNDSEFHGLITAGNLNGSGSLVLGDRATASHFICKEGTKHNLYHGEGWNFSDFWLYEAYWRGVGSTLAVYNMATPTGLANTYTRGVAEITNGDGLGSNLSGWHGHINVGGQFGPITYDDCASVGFSGLGASGFQGVDSDHIYWSHCLNLNCYIGFQLYDTTGNLTYHVIDCAHDSNVVGSRAMAFSNNAVFEIDGFYINILQNSTFGLALLTANNPNGTVTRMEVYGKAGQTYAFRHTGTGGAVSFSNCHFDTLFRFYHTTLGAATITSDNNNFAQDMGSQVEGVAYANIADYQAGTGQDANSTIGA